MGRGKAYIDEKINVEDTIIINEALFETRTKMIMNKEEASLIFVAYQNINSYKDLASKCCVVLDKDVNTFVIGNAINLGFKRFIYDKTNKNEYIVALLVMKMNCFGSNFFAKTVLNYYLFNNDTLELTIADSTDYWFDTYRINFNSSVIEDTYNNQKYKIDRRIMSAIYQRYVKGIDKKVINELREIRRIVKNETFLDYVGLGGLVEDV